MVIMVLNEHKRQQINWKYFKNAFNILATTTTTTNNIHSQNDNDDEVQNKETKREEIFILNFTYKLSFSLVMLRAGKIFGVS